jgi:hypothetical protein
MLLYAQTGQNLSIPGDFFTVASLASFGGVVLITTVVCNALQYAFNFNPRWLALVVAVGLCLATFAAAETHPALGWLIAVANGCLVYLTSIGVTTVGSSMTNPKPPAGGASTVPIPRGGKRTFWSPWF